MAGEGKGRLVISSFASTQKLLQLARSPKAYVAIYPEQPVTENTSSGIEERISHK